MTLLACRIALNVNIRASWYSKTHFTHGYNGMCGYSHTQHCSTCSLFGVCLYSCAWGISLKLCLLIVWSTSVCMRCSLCLWVIHSFYWPNNNFCIVMCVYSWAWGFLWSYAYVLIVWSTMQCLHAMQSLFLYHYEWFSCLHSFYWPNNNFSYCPYAACWSSFTCCFWRITQYLH